VISVTDNLSSQGITTYTYDLDERVTEVASSYGGTAGPQVAVSYDADSLIAAESRTIGGSGTSVNTSYGYDSAERETTITDWQHTPEGSGGGVTTNLATYVYSYDKADLVTSEVDAEGTYTYTYDKADELTSAYENGTPVGTYSYDLNGNQNGTGYSTGTDNEQTASPGYTYTYDKAGNLIAETNTSTHSTTTYTYDYDNRLTEVTTGGTVVATYTYDALGQRIGTDDNGTQTWTVYDGTNPYADFNGSGTLEVRYQYGPGVVDGAVVDELLARTSASGTSAWYLTDKLGSVRDIVSSAGSELDHIVYDSFGNIVTETNAADGDRFKFAGMQYDATTGQYYDQARWYGPGTGLFDSEDPTGFGGGDVNLFRYVGNDPTDATDPTGTQSSSSNGGPPEQLIAGVNASVGTHPGYVPPGSTFSWDEMLDNGANFAAGYGDTMSCGVTYRIRNNLSIVGVSLNAGINTNSGYYQAGQVAGTVHSTALSFVSPCQAGSMSTGLRAINGIQAGGGLLNAGDNFSKGNNAAGILDLIGVWGNASQMNQSCFAAGTPILTVDGAKPIEEIRIGDLVLSRPEHDSDAPVVPRRVLNLFQNTSQLTSIHLKGRRIYTTFEHPFWVEGHGWLAAGRIEKGALLVGAEGERTAVDAIEIHVASAPVYNLHVEDCHTYFVGGPAWLFSVWAHNSKYASLNHLFGDHFDDELTHSVNMLHGPGWDIDHYVGKIDKLNTPCPILGPLQDSHLRITVWMQNYLDGTMQKFSVNYDAAAQYFGWIKAAKNQSHS
jgi:RHS repeat-associated protein